LFICPYRNYHKLALLENYQKEKRYVPCCTVRKATQKALNMFVAQLQRGFQCGFVEGLQKI
jgi:hypothetical protein